MFALVDYDPDGIAIMRTYKYGSRGLDHEGDSTVPHLRWLGIRSSDLFGSQNPLHELDSQYSSSQESQLDSSQESLTFSSNGNEISNFNSVREERRKGLPRN